MADFHQAMCDEEAIVSRYKDLEWTDDVRGFECARCGRVLIQHYVANCLHKFCYNCRKLVGDGSQRWRCPQCQEFIRTIETQDFEFRNQVYELGVHCPNKKYGCKHTCPLKELKGHMDRCEHTRESALPVLYEGNTQGLEVLELRTEVREMRQMMLQMEKRWNDNEVGREMDLVAIDCRMDDICSKLRVETTAMKKESSDLKHEMSLVVEENKSKMLKLDVKSDVLMDMLEKKEKDLRIEIQNVKKQMENQSENLKKINQSIEVLEKDLSESKAEIGKNVKKLKTDPEKLIKEEIGKVEKEMQLFESKLNELVLRVNDKMEDVWQLNRKLTKVEETVETLRTEVANELLQNKTIKKLTTQTNLFNLIEHNSSFSPDFQWKISGIKEQLKEGKLEMTSAVFQWAKYPAVRARAKLEASELGYVNMSLCLEGPNKVKTIDFKLIPHVYYLLRDQTKTNSPKHICVMKDYNFTTKFHYSLAFGVSIQLPNTSILANPTYNADDSIVIDIYVEPPKMAQRVYSYDGTLDWTIDNCQQRKEMEKKGLVSYQESPYFYTGPRGYRMQVSMCLTGGLNACVDFLPGEFDAELPLIFPHRTTITLFNQKDPQRNVTKTVKKDIKNSKRYTVDGCSEKEVDRLIENDTLHCNVTIEAI